MANRWKEKERDSVNETLLETAYVHGSAAPKLDFPVRETESPGRNGRRQSAEDDSSPLSMNLGYLLFLAVAAIAVVAICVNYLRLRSEYTTLQKEYTAKEADLSERILENDAIYNGIISSVNLEHVKEVATGKLGMIYATGDQIITYQETEKDYVKQYRDIP